MPNKVKIKEYVHELLLPSQNPRSPNCTSNSIHYTLAHQTDLSPETTWIEAFQDGDSRPVHLETDHPQECMTSTLIYKGGGQGLKCKGVRPITITWMSFLQMRFAWSFLGCSLNWKTNCPTPEWDIIICSIWNLDTGVWQISESKLLQSKFMLSGLWPDNL